LTGERRGRRDRLGFAGSCELPTRPLPAARRRAAHRLHALSRRLTARLLPASANFQSRIHRPAPAPSVAAVEKAIAMPRIVPKRHLRATYDAEIADQAQHADAAHDYAAAKRQALDDAAARHGISVSGRRSVYDQ